ncbi:MAG TPA: YDG domain-containing protein, partial [Candidatus Limnocylindrales bacterium]|nr:YDG domain-containing protein [Candidatus Limnocylindrales bacterium]
MTGTLVRRTFVAVQVFLLIAMLFAPLPAAAADPSADPGASAPPSAEPSATPDPTAEPTAEATADPTVEPSAEATTEPAAPTPPPTAEPTAQPTAEPPAPTPAPTATPTTEPLPAPIGSPTIGSDLEDYPPGGLVTLTGAHWAPGESVHIFVNDDWGSSWSRNVDVVADASGTIVDQFNLPNWFVAVYSVAATGSSGSMARATFTDSNPSAVTVGSPTSRTVVQGGTATFGTLTVAAGGNGSACDTTLSIIAGTGTGLPSGVTGNFGANPVTTTGGNASTTFSVTTTSSTPPGTYTFQVSGVDSQPPGGACQGGATNTPSVLLTLTVTAGTVATSTALSSSSNPSIYGGSVTFTATVTGSTSPNNAGTVTFKDGSSVICLSVPLAAGAAGCTTSALAVTAAPHSMTAEYSGATGFAASTSPAILQVITPKDVVITPHASQAKVYGTPDPTLTFTNNGGLGAGAFSGSLGRAAGDDVGSYAISLGSLSAGANYNLNMVSATFAITAAPLTVDFVAAGKVYDTTTAASITSCSVGPVLGLDEVTCDASLATASFASATAGSHTVSGSGFGLAGADAANYAITLTHTTSATIGQAASTVTVDCTAGAPFTYSGDPITPCTATASGAGMSPLDVTGSLVYTANTDAGSASAEASWAGDLNHSASTGSGGFSIGQAASTVTVTCPVSVVYNAAAQSACEVSVTGAGGLDLSPDATYAMNTDVGTASAAYTFPGDANHIGSFGSDTFAITAAPLTVDFVAAGKVYDTTTAASITSCSVGPVLGLDEVTCDASLASASFASAAAGSHTVSGSGFGLAGADAGNYEIVGVDPTSAEITKAPSTVTVDCTAGVPFTFSGVAQTPCTAQATGIGLSPVDVTTSIVYADNLHAGTASADAT